MKKTYEVKYKDGNEIITAIAKGYALIGSLYELCRYRNIYENLVAVYEISFERYHALNTAAAIRETDTWDECEPECAELCCLAGMESEWLDADWDTFESVLEKAAERLNVKI